MILVIICSFGAGIFIAQYKVYPYSEIRSAAINIRNLIGFQDDSEYRADPFSSDYPHLRVTRFGTLSPEETALIIRSDKSPIPNQINFFDPLTGSYAFSLSKEDFHITELPLSQCVLINGEGCSYYAKYQPKKNEMLKGDFLISFDVSINERSHGPRTDFVKFPNEKQCDIAVVYPDYTFLAYNNYGGHSLYSQPFPLAGIMSSSIVAYDRPMMLSDITKTYFPTNTIARAIQKMDVGCISLETNSSLEDHKRINRFKLIVLTGHDEYWTDTLAANIDAYIKSGKSLAVFSGNTNFRRIVINKNSVQRDKHTDEFYPTENIIGLACRFGCLPEREILNVHPKNSHFLTNKDLRGMKVLDESHRIFKNSGLKKNDFFGRESGLVWYEVDGAPLDLNTEEIAYGRAPSVTLGYDGETLLNAQYEALNVRPLASTHLRYFGSNESQYAATIVEYKNGKGTVINGGSVGWYRSIEKKDALVTSIFQNSITYLLEISQ